MNKKGQVNVLALICVCTHFHVLAGRKKNKDLVVPENAEGDENALRLKPEGISKVQRKCLKK